jgi:oxazoline/thiazoline dehydrogenase
MSGPALCLKPTVLLLEDAGCPAGLEEPGVRRLRLTQPNPVAQAFLAALASGRATEEDLCGVGARASEACRYLLAQAEREGWVRYALVREGRPWATLEPLATALRVEPPPAATPCRLSRFAWVRRLEDGTLALECALGLGRVRLHHPEALAWAGHLALPRTPRELAGATGLAETEAATLLALTNAAGATAPCDPDGRLPEDGDPDLRPWEFHDLLFHTRSRGGRHGGGSGGTYRFLGQMDPLPALKPALPEATLPLPAPGPPGPAPGFFQVLEARRSLRSPGDSPITLDELGAFLHPVARIRNVLPADPEAGRPYEAVSAPCPGGGGLHELELYLSVGRCEGLPPGFYHYAADAHALRPWPGSRPAQERLLEQARQAMGAARAPDILLTLAARAQRVAWKYEAIAYALILKDTGVMLHQMYLVATALGLAPCALGTGDLPTFALASGLPFPREAPVGEFALSGGGGRAPGPFPLPPVSEG